MEINHIAIMHKRTPNAIFLKIIREASKIAEDDYDISLNDLSIITSLNTSKLLEGFKKINYKRFDDEIETDDEDNDDEIETDDEDDNEIKTDNEDNEIKTDNEDNEIKTEDEDNEINYYSFLMISTLISGVCWALYTI